MGACGCISLALTAHVAVMVAVNDCQSGAQAVSASRIWRGLGSLSASALARSANLRRSYMSPRLPAVETRRSSASRVRVGHLIPVVAVFYLILIVYQITLWHQTDPAPSRPVAPRSGGRS